MTGSEEMLTVTFQDSSRLVASGLERRETDWLCDAAGRMCLELVKNAGAQQGALEVSSRDRSQLNLRV